MKLNEVNSFCEAAPCGTVLRTCQRIPSFGINPCTASVAGRTAPAGEKMCTGRGKLISRSLSLSAKSFASPCWQFFCHVEAIFTRRRAAAGGGSASPVLPREELGDLGQSRTQHCPMQVQLLTHLGPFGDCWDWCHHWAHPTISP